MPDEPQRQSPPTHPGQVPTASEEPMGEYQRVAETVGMVPSFRWKDNLYQSLVVFVSAGLGALVGWLVRGDKWGAMIGALAGLIIGGLGSGFVLMILGWIRASKK